MNNYTILLGMDNVQMVCDTNYIMYAMVEGKLYDAFSGKPVNHGGRQLRENSRKLIDSIRDDAFSVMESLKDEREKAINAAVEKALAEKPQETPSKPRKAPQSMGMLESMLLDTVSKYASEKVLESILPAVREKVLAEFGPLPVKHEITLPDGGKWETTEILHKEFDKMRNMLVRGYGVYMYGPAGTGKSRIAKQMSKALNIPYHTSTAVSDDVSIKGYKDAGGNYHPTEFYKAFVNGGLFFLDELDASLPDVLNLINNALAEGEFPFPDGLKEKHPDFYVMAAGNTACNGATAQYTGRYALDKATMDRFFFVPVSYDEQIEIALAKGDKALVEFTHDFRKTCENAGIQCLFTYRGISRISDSIDFMSKEDAITFGILQGMDISDITVIANSLTINNDWSVAFKNLTERR